jgi:hypothetical protein
MHCTPISCLKLPGVNPKWSRLLCSFLTVLALGISGSHAAQAELNDEIGYNKLVSALGGNLPLGEGVPISLVEAGGANIIYYPDVSNSQFNASGDPLGIPVTFIDGTGLKSNGTSSHATNMAQRFLGNTLSMAPAANVVTVYEAGRYLRQDVLKAPSGGAPSTQDFRVQNFSWIGSLAENMNDPTPTEIQNDIKALRRFDFVINRDNVTAVVGVNNNTNPLPRLMSHSYNAIVVGRTDGIHSSGFTVLNDYGLGRSKPDIVVPLGTSSAATAVTSSAATMLHSAVAGTDAANSQVMKAILMAGATKDPFSSWSRTSTQPLDTTFGAGQLNVYNSYLMTLGGQYASTPGNPASVGSYGWDYQTIAPGAGNSLEYVFDIPVGSIANELSIVLAWNVQTQAPFTSQTLANLDMKLFDSFGEVVDQSLSTVDNVEHIYLTDLDAGSYTLVVSSNSTRDYGLAWRMSTEFLEYSADFNGDGVIDGSDFMAWQRGFGTLLGATAADGDANGDGAVDHLDLSIFNSQLAAQSGAPPAMVGSLFSVPEPTGMALAVLIGTYLFLARKPLNGFSS